MVFFSYNQNWVQMVLEYEYTSETWKHFWSWISTLGWLGLFAGLGTASAGGGHNTVGRSSAKGWLQGQDEVRSSEKTG